MFKVYAYYGKWFLTTFTTAREAVMFACDVRGMGGKSEVYDADGGIFSTSEMIALVGADYVSPEQY